MKKYIITLVISVFAFNFAVAQNSTFSIGSLKLGVAHSSNTIVNTFGNPTNTTSQIDEQTGALHTMFNYSNFSIEKNDRHYITYFVLSPGCTLKVNGLVGVGDPVSKISQLSSSGTIKTSNWSGTPVTLLFGRVNGQMMESPVVFYHNGSTITGISFSVLK